MAQVTAADGITYERSCIEEWFKLHGSSPLTNLPLAHKRLKPNRELRTQIRRKYGYLETESPAPMPPPKNANAPSAAPPAFAGHAQPPAFAPLPPRPAPARPTALASGEKRGKIRRWYPAPKCFGFVTPNDGGPDLFIHISAVQETSDPPFKIGDPVSFTYAKGFGSSGRPQGANVRKITTPGRR